MKKTAIVSLIVLALSLVAFAQWNNPATGRATFGISNILLTNKNLASNVAVSATTQTTIDSITLSALPAACATNACRIRVSYADYLGGGTYGFCWVTDGTTNWALSSEAVAQTNFSTCANSMLSPSQYSSGATPTITLMIVDNGGLTVCTTTTVGSAPCNTTPTNSPAVRSAMQVEVIVSN